MNSISSHENREMTRTGSCPDRLTTGQRLAHVPTVQPRLTTRVLLQESVMPPPEQPTMTPEQPTMAPEQPTTPEQLQDPWASK